MDKKKLISDYKNTKVPMGIYMIKNKVTGKVLLGSSLNLNGPLNRHKFELKTGMHKNPELMEDWKKYGEENFSFEFLETLKYHDDPEYNYEDDLKLLEMMTIEKFAPFTDNVYNKNENLSKSFF
jgi:group I intron endonuclease